MLNPKTLKEFFFLITLALLFFAMIYILSPYIGIIFIALIIEELFHPVYKFIYGKLKSEALAATLSGILALLVVVIPLILVSIVVVFQAESLLKETEGFWEKDALLEKYNSVLDDANSFIARFSDDPDDQLTTPEVKEQIENISNDALNYIIDAFTNTATSALGIVTKFFMFIITLFTLFPMRERLIKTLKKFSPLEDELDDMFIRNFTITIKSIVKGTLLVGIMIGIAMGLMFWALGISAPVFWAVLMTVLSIVPVGSGLVWIPVSGYLVATGEPIKALVLFSFGIFITNVDNLVRSYLTKNDTKLHPLLLTFAILGGVEAFGILGLIYGPVIAVFFMSMAQVYRKKYK